LKAAREELLQETDDDTPPKDNTAIQTHAKDSDTDKMNEIMEKNKEYEKEDKKEKT
jgi:hypothetical protein